MRAHLSVRQRSALPIMLGCLGGALVVSLVVGDVTLSLAQLWGGLIRQDEFAATVLWQIRLPRALVAIEIGAALAASGVVMQAFFS